MHSGKGSFEVAFDAVIDLIERDARYNRIHPDIVVEALDGDSKASGFPTPEQVKTIADAHSSEFELCVSFPQLSNLLWTSFECGCIERSIRSACDLISPTVGADNEKLNEFLCMQVRCSCCGMSMHLVSALVRTEIEGNPLICNSCALEERDARDSEFKQTFEQMSVYS